MSTTLNNPFAPTGPANFLASRDNPLSLNRVGKIRYRFAQHDWSWQLAHLQSLRFRAAIVGHQGSGKTTLLCELGDQLNRSNIPNHYVVLPSESTDHRTMVRQSISCVQHGSIILVDGIERLSFILRWQLLKQTKRGPGLVVTVHQACHLPTWVHCQTNPELMKSVLADLGLADPAIEAAALQAFESSGGNVRNALRELYDQFAAGRFNHILSR